MSDIASNKYDSDNTHVVNDTTKYEYLNEVTHKFIGCNIKDVIHLSTFDRTSYLVSLQM